MSKYKALETLQTVPGLYEQAKIDDGGYGVIWNDDVDLSADGIYENGVDCSPPYNI